TEFQLLTKSLRPLPEKYHGLKDIEQRYRQRYLDLIMNRDSKQTFVLRSRIIEETRRYLNQQGCLEVETPMLHTIPGGAAARPLENHRSVRRRHQSMGLANDLADPRRVVRAVAEQSVLARGCRNDGVSARHNAEFTVVALLGAYAHFYDSLPLTEDLVVRIGQ